MKVDTIIVGAGTAGLSALREVRCYTDDFLLVNDGHWGTTCATSGCMPPKALIEVANAFHHRHAIDSFGICGTVTQAWSRERYSLPSTDRNCRRCSCVASDKPGRLRVD